MIYENDIPGMPEKNKRIEQIINTWPPGSEQEKSILRKDLQDLAYGVVERPKKAVERYGLYNRWKPNGITNNIEQYEAKAGLKGETRLKKRMWKHALSKAVYNYCKNIHHDKSTPQNREKKRNTYIQRR